MCAYIHIYTYTHYIFTNLLIYYRLLKFLLLYNSALCICIQFNSNSHFQLKRRPFKASLHWCSIWEPRATAIIEPHANACLTQESQRSPLTEAGQEPWRVFSMVMPCLSQKDENRWLCAAAMQGPRRWSKSTLITEIRDTRGAAEQHLANSVCRALFEDDKPHVIYMSAFSFRYATPTVAHGWEF